MSVSSSAPSLDGGSCQDESCRDESSRDVPCQDEPCQDERCAGGEGPGLVAEDDVLVRELAIVNKRGLHARASAKFVQTVERFDAQICVCRNGDRVCGTSIMGLMMLAAATGTSITVSATGPDAQNAMAALADLVANRFGEEE